jgi:hypothetical protein
MQTAFCILDLTTRLSFALIHYKNLLCVKPT